MQSGDALQRAIKDGATVASTLLTKSGVLASGVFALDWLLLRTGGVPPGRLLEFFGEESAGKSLLAYRFAAAGQRLYPDRQVTILETEGGLRDAQSLRWCARQGVDLDRLPLFTAEESLEQLFDRMEWCCLSGDYSVVILDSLAEAYPESMLKARTLRGDKARTWGALRPVAAEANIVTEFMKRLIPLAKRTETTIIFINQIRDMPGVQTFFGNPTTTPGGRALRHSASLRLEMHRQGEIRVPIARDAKRAVGVEIGIRVVKSKFSPPGGRTGIDTSGPLRLLFDAADPLDESGDVLYAAEGAGIIEANGAWLSWPGEDLKVQGRENFAAKLSLLDKWPALREQVIAHITAEAAHDGGTASGVSSSAEGDD